MEGSTFCRPCETDVLPQKLYISTQTGRQYLLAWMPRNRQFTFIRTDLIDEVKIGEQIMIPEKLKERLRVFQSHVWGAAAGNRSTPEHLEMTLLVRENEGFIVNRRERDEEHILRRLEREKRCGTVEQLDRTHWRFSADVYDAVEMLPWIRTFTGRIAKLECSNPHVTDRFYKDLEMMAVMYGGESNAVS